MSSRTPSIDSKGVQTDLLSNTAETANDTKSSQKNAVMNQLSTPSVEREYK